MVKEDAFYCDDEKRLRHFIVHKDIEKDYQNHRREIKKSNNIIKELPGTANLYDNCLNCGKTLRNLKSKKYGYDLSCRRKMKRNL